MKHYHGRSPHTRDFIQGAKGIIQSHLSQLGLSHRALSEGTGISRNNIQRWLNPNNDSFMTLGDAAVICEFLGISLQSVLPEPYWTVMEDQELAELLRRAEKIPNDHLRSILDCYSAITGKAVPDYIRNEMKNNK